MDQLTVLLRLKEYFIQNVLEGVEDDFDEYTSLRDWGFINSIEIARLVAFINDTFAVDVPPEKMTPTIFQNLHMIANMILDVAVIGLD